MSLKDKLDLQRLPRHIAIIMDGNGRWAKERGQDRLYGHHEGVESVRNIVETCAELGIGYLTLYAFSTENWDRPVYEVNGIMELLVNTIRREVTTLSKNNIRLTMIGDMNMLPPQCQREMEEAIAFTSQNTGLNLVMALSYSARWEIVNAARKIAQDVKNGTLDPLAVTPAVWESYLCTAGIPDPELVIRTSGECRISNFLLYQLAYAELYFTDTRWPDFRQENLYQAILNFQNRERRFGKTSEQIQQNEEIIS
ncbi:undecaprenyl diphosphate synthase [Chitinophaga terrae (ex Kim and Jung 2007)]|jgi:undecaprenyl diphosphate synthase|uniref:Isoprenyl transferase n=1 Tax=Chitinophaga terrae (ex Kim and Jung 2007) TaxID=408074 RepID=A0A1H3XUX8_9BACT|nr:isoprenyl transferase [Chitinophaga terrae (ex Kim and Jung 2007)]MDQ0105737.1 undecaprenyl diphosphate synthase [Chitinophaga terrae (ex Kim and Jung 2007)]GEP89410.1 isoprenyl transferase [Chitinophaga terrae (ex Kim and Jung 2007)]SEA03265.1 undecaprenyl diphosphate synthase [Chitinophaga terrae (ex Kim and Jung 2007)]